MTKVFITSGAVCDKRKLDLNQIKQYLLQNDYEVVDSPKKADAIVISTCGVTDSFATISLKKIEEFKNFNGKVIVTGCLPDTDKQRLDRVFKGPSFSTKHIEDIENYFPKKSVSFSELEDCNLLWANVNRDKVRDMVKSLFLKYTLARKMYVGFFNQISRYMIGENHLILHTFYALNLPVDDLFLIRVASGCWGNCAYCVTKKAVGEFKSKPLALCVNEFRKGLEKGYSNFFLTAEDTGGYGLDNGSTFPDLLDAMMNLDGGYSINIYAVNPQWVVKYVDRLEEIVKKGRIKAICIPIQSGSPRVLHLMNRYENVDKMKDALVRLKKACPDLCLATHCIVGFPSETDQEFRETLEFIASANFDLGFLTSISIRTNTAAEKIEPKISPREKSKRVKDAQKNLRKSGYRSFRIKDTFIFHKGSKDLSVNQE